MSEENNPIEDENGKSGFEEAADNIKDSASSAAKEFKEGWNEATSNDNKKILAGVLAILLGSLGIHKFILGYNKEGIILLVVTLILGVFTCGIGASIAGIIGLIEGIIYLTKSDEEFHNTYVVGKKPWF